MWQSGESVSDHSYAVFHSVLEAVLPPERVSEIEDKGNSYHMNHKPSRAQEPESFWKINHANHLALLIPNIANLAGV